MSTDSTLAGEASIIRAELLFHSITFLSHLNTDVSLTLFTMPTHACRVFLIVGPPRISGLQCFLTMPTED